jgi:REP element-mobilizing transposase RayT
MAHTYTSILVHAVFSTSGRAPLLTDDLRPEMHAYLAGILRRLEAVPIIVGGATDHVHLLARLPADLAVSDCLRMLKTNSSRWAKQRWPQRRSFAWQGGYGAFSVSESKRGAVIRYIQDQEQHHRRISFQEELLKLLKNHGVEFDERYIWQ